MRPLIQGKKKEIWKILKNPKNSCEIIVVHLLFILLKLHFYNLLSEFDLLPLLFSLCAYFDTEQHAISSSQLSKTFWLFNLLILFNYN